MSTLRKKPWNRVDQPVYSISSAYNGMVNMNICSYVTPVSMKPKRYIVAVYKSTKTLELVKKQQEFILQFLSDKHYKLVPLLGKKSGFSVDKIKKISEHICFHEAFPVLQSALGFIHFRIREWLDGGDHWCVLCDVVSFKNLNEGKPLTLDLLKRKSIIRS